MSSQFPPIEPHRTGQLAVSSGHSLYWEQCGAPAGLPLLVLHGGPGSGCSERFQRMFDPDRFHITLMDQRGCGRSTPHLSLDANTTADLVSDIEALRTHLGLERWIVFGPSWGSTLALAYAQAFPERVSALVVGAVFLATPDNLDWWHSEAGAPRFFPEAFADFIAPVPERFRSSPPAIMDWCFEDMQRERADGLTALSRLSDPKASLAELRQSTLYRWTEYEDRLSWLDQSADVTRTGLAERGPDFVAAHSLIEAHYFRNGCFLEPDQLIANAHRLADIPMQILHSRYDMVCPPRGAIRLAAACPHADLHMVAVNGHAMTDAVLGRLNAVMAGVQG
ncbi:prolyl aminopeptidase [uncultured Maricaulis sp.]|uniref:prolyl aminopeptidase n=1 Tax=uncultured Maricaulis sp. TaxID=174710 RepID=UPI0030D97C5C|tara:strand:- start:67617 stop:68627 length:1011 start_codon:yes stop_codon:yes gene_type:complete